ncbi:MAG: alpha/beta fold hydrolase [Actinomycetota bacterium]
MTDIELTIPTTTATGDLTLAATLTIADGAPGPAALLISGSGPIDRNSDAKRLPIGVMGRIAATLADHGIASLRYDKRGVGGSGGDYLSTGFQDNVADARAALEVLLARPDVDPTRITVIGHSEGALIASALGDDERVAGVALLAGTTRNGRDLLTWQAEQVAPTLPTPVRWLLKLLRQDLVRTQRKRLDRIETSTDDVIRIQLVKLNARWFREFMAFEPTEALARVAVPVLALTGSKDIQVPPDDVREMWRHVPTPVTGEVVVDVSHLLRNEPGPPTVRTYKKQARQPLDERLLALLVEWTAPASAESDTSTASTASTGETERQPAGSRSTAQADV